MAIDVWVTDAAKAVRPITMEPREPLEVVAGDRLELIDVELDAVRLIRAGGDLIVRLESGFEYSFGEFVHLLEIDADVAMAFAGGEIIDSLLGLMALLQEEIELLPSEFAPAAGPEALDTPTTGGTLRADGSIELEDVGDDRFSVDDDGEPALGEVIFEGVAPTVPEPFVSPPTPPPPPPPTTLPPPTEPPVIVVEPPPASNTPPEAYDLAVTASFSADPGVVLLDFEGLADLEPVDFFYDGGTGGFGSGPGTDFNIQFSANSLAIIDADAGGTGNFGGEPSPDTILFFLTGAAAGMNVPDGFDTGFSFFYSAASEPGFVKVFDGLDGTGNLLATIILPVTPSDGGDPTGFNSPFFPIGVEFEGTALSIEFGGTFNKIAFDNITFGSAVPDSEFSVTFDIGGLDDGASLGGSDLEDGSTTEITITELPEFGQLFADLDGDGILDILSVGDILLDDGDGTADDLLYVTDERPPDGQDSFAYITTDSSGLISDSATVLVEFP